MPQSRRQQILEILINTPEPVKGGKLSEILGVSRQIIVQDIALLRAEGESIVATPQGYLLLNNSAHVAKQSRIFACQHDSKGMAEELTIIVDNGGKVLDVIVEHPLYGELKGNLMLEKHSDVQQFLENMKLSKAEPLSALTKGIHLHTIEAPSQGVLDKIHQELNKAGFLA
ncbi:MAG: transcription repressor NadR [Bacillota bacterium]